MRNTRVTLAWFSLPISLLGACGGSTPPAPEARSRPPVTTAKAEEAYDPCKSSSPLQKSYKGLLRDAKCDQEVFMRMAGFASQLGVECTYCHAPKEGAAADELDYPKMTPNKQKALFMGHHFLDGLRRRDGGKVECFHCHVNKAGKADAKFLGRPRDQKLTLEWMNLTLTNDFVTTDGGKLKCKHCHGAAFGMPAFHPRVILGTPRLPGVAPFVPHEEPAPPASEAPSASSAPKLAQ